MPGLRRLSGDSSPRVAFEVGWAPLCGESKEGGDSSKPWGLPASRGQEDGQELGLEIEEKQPGSE